MSSANKRKGSQWERDLEEYCNRIGLKARRLPRAGSNDIGDVAIELGNGHVIVVEAKNVKSVDMAEFLRQASTESENYDRKYNTTTYGVVAVKTRQKGVGEGRITMTVDTLINLLKWNSLT
jgi:Holliday junction resolvase